MAGAERVNAYLACAYLVKGHKGKSLGQHGRRQVLFGHDEGDEYAREGQLREEHNRLDAKGREAGKGRRQVELGVVRAKVVTVVDASDVVEVGVRQKRGAVAKSSC